MKKILYFLFLLFAVVGCNDSEDYIDQTPEKAFDSDIQNKNYSGYVSHPFFEVDYVQNALGVNLNRVVSSTKVYDVMNEVSTIPRIDEEIASFEIQNAYPCWSCAESDYTTDGRIEIVLIPVVNLKSQKVIGLLTGEISASSINVRYQLHNTIEILNHHQDKNSSSNYFYYNRFYNFFQELIQNKNPNVIDYLNLKRLKSKCGWDSTRGCFCQGEMECVRDIAVTTETDTPLKSDCDHMHCEEVRELESLDNDGGRGGGITIPPRDPPPYPPTWTNGGTNDGTDGGTIVIGGTNTGSTGTELPPWINLPNGNWNGSDFDDFDFDDSVFDGTLSDAVNIINNLVLHLDNNTNVVLNPDNLNAITAVSNFINIILPLYTSLVVNGENHTTSSIQNLLNFVVNQVGFITSPEETVFLLNNSEFTNTLDNWLLNHNDELGEELGRHTLELFINNTRNDIRLHFIELSRIYNLIDFELEDLFGFDEAEINEIKEGLLDQDIAIKKIDWVGSSDTEKISHLYKYFVYINYVNSQFSWSSRDYSIESFFMDPRGHGRVFLNGDIDTKVLGEDVFIGDVGLDVVGIFTPNTFPLNGIVGYIPNKTTLCFPKTGSSDCAFAILTFYILDDDWSLFYSNF